MALSFELSGSCFARAAEPQPQELFGDAVQLFFEAKPVESAQKFDQLVLAVPGAEPELWQRGLALYHAERPQKDSSGRRRRQGPMKEILQLYAGRCEPDAVLRAAEQGQGEARRNQLCYAHLFLGLSFEAVGDARKAREHITQAAGPCRMEHSMGNVAVMHAKLRKWPVEDAGQSQP